jgi:hypothetical protein
MRVPIPLALSVMILICPRALLSADTSDIEVVTSVSWTTASRPEVNVLLQNKTQQSVEFSMSLQEPPDESRPMCTRRAESLPKTLPQHTTLRDTPESFGRIPARGWTHRAILPTGPYFRAPCEIKLLVRFPGSTIADIRTLVHVPESQPAPIVASDSLPRLNAGIVVERDMYERHVLVRLLVRNDGHVGEQISISDREIRCNEGSRADWSTEYPVPQGQGIGPASVDPDSWTVLVSAARLINGESFDECEGTLAISRMTPRGLELWKPISFGLLPSGYLQLPLIVDEL